MTARRQENKGQRIFASVFATVFALLPGSAAVVEAATTERIITDYYTGLAIGGFDPVAYFTDREPRRGAQDVEAFWGGALWSFRNDRNKAIFLANPEVYGPQFGGYDPFDLARGKVVAGRPGIWLIAGQRLYLFNKAENRDAFAKDSSRLEKATGNWPKLSSTLADY
jgi:hypothetical protein